MASKRKKGLAAVLGTVVSIAVPIFAPAIAGVIGASGAIATAAIGAAGGAAGAALSGGNPLTGAVMGGVGGFLSGGGLGLNTSSAAAVSKNGVAIQQGASTAGFGTAIDKIASPLLPAGYQYAGKGLESVYTGTQLTPYSIAPTQSFNPGIPGAPTAPTPISPAPAPSAPAVAPKAPTYSVGAPQQTPYVQNGQPLDLNTPTNPTQGPTQTAGLNTSSSGIGQTQYSAAPMDPASSVAQQRAAAGTQQAAGKSVPAAVTTATPDAAPRAGLASRVGKYALNNAVPLMNVAGSLFGGGEADIPDLSWLTNQDPNDPNNPDNVNQRVLESADNQDRINEETYKYQFNRTKQRAMEADQMDPQEFARMQALIEGERAGTLSREQQRELARRRGRNTGKRGAARERRAGLDMARATAVGDRAGYERGLAAKNAVDAAARAWLPGQFSAADTTRLNANTSGQNANQQRAQIEQWQYQAEQDAAERQRARIGATVGLVSGLFNKQPGRPEEQQLWR